MNNSTKALEKMQKEQKWERIRQLRKKLATTKYNIEVSKEIMAETPSDAQQEQLRQNIRRQHGIAGIEKKFGISSKNWRNKNRKNPIPSRSCEKGRIGDLLFYPRFPRRSWCEKGIALNLLLSHQIKLNQKTPSCFGTAFLGLGTGNGGVVHGAIGQFLHRVGLGLGPIVDVALLWCCTMTLWLATALTSWLTLFW